MTIRRAVPADAPALHVLAAATFGLATPEHTTQDAIEAFVASVLSEARFDEYLADPQRILLVDDTDGVLVGYTMLVLGDPYDDGVAQQVTIRPTVELSKCYVLPDSHRSGLASLLMAASLDAARDAGAAGCWLGVNEENARAQRFYAKHGFTQVGTKQFLVGDRWEDDWVMERAL